MGLSLLGSGPWGVELRIVDPWSLEGEAVRSTPQAGHMCVMSASWGPARVRHLRDVSKTGPRH